MRQKDFIAYDTINGTNYSGYRNKIRKLKIKKIFDKNINKKPTD